MTRIPRPPDDGYGRDQYPWEDLGGQPQDEPATSLPVDKQAHLAREIAAERASIIPNPKGLTPDEHAKQAEGWRNLKKELLGENKPELLRLFDIEKPYEK